MLSSMSEIGLSMTGDKKLFVNMQKRIIYVLPFFLEYENRFVFVI